MNDIINVTQPSLPPLDDYIKELESIWDSHWLTNQASKHQALEKALKDHLHVKMAALFVNGHLSLEAILEAYQLSGEIITTPFTFPSTAHAIVRSGCTPVFADIDPLTYNLDPAQIEALITDQTVAILPVHLFGYPCEVDAIEAIAKKHGLRVIYDAAHAFGVTHKGQPIGHYGDASMFSMNATKVYHTIEGGLITSKDEELYDALKLIRHYGMLSADDIIYPGSNLQMNEFQAAMGLVNLKYVDHERAQRQRVHDRYQAGLKRTPGIKLPAVPSDTQLAYSYFPILLTGYPETRDALHLRLAAHGIHAKKYFSPLVPSYACYAQDSLRAPLPVAERIADNILVLPLYANLADDDIDRIIDLIQHPAP
jgi:dTDP-4-amino-4,6-dideoxygalactose transaminase